MKHLKRKRRRKKRKRRKRRKRRKEKEGGRRRKEEEEEEEEEEGGRRRKEEKEEYYNNNRTFTVSSEQIADSWVPIMIAVNIPKRIASNMRNMRKMVVAGGETPEQSETRNTVTNETLEILK